MTPSVSIVTTTYNSASYIDRTIKAVLAQDTEGLSVDYILSDDGSSDETVKAIRRALTSAPFSTRVIEHPHNIGVVRNFFNAVHSASGKFLAICDSDDVWLDQEKLVKQVQYMEARPGCVLSYHATVEVDAAHADAITSSNFPKSKLRKNPHTSTLMVRRDAIEFPWPLIEKMTRMNDQLLRFLVSRRGKFEFIETIHPTLRVVREQSVFASPRSELVRRKSSLHNWSLIRDHFIGSPESGYLTRRVNGFQSKVNWLAYDESPSMHGWMQSAWFDVKTGTALRKAGRRVRGTAARALKALRGAGK